MPEIKVKVGNRNLAVYYEDGEAGFIEVRDDDSDISLHIRKEEDTLIGIHFVAGEEEPANQFDLDSGDVF